MSTLSVPALYTSPRDDAIQLHTACKGMGCDTSSVINVLAHRDATQRSLIHQEYRSMYSEDLLNRLASKLHGRLEEAVLLWMHDPAGRVAILLKQTKFDVANEVIFSHTPSQIHLIKYAYHSRFGVPLEKDIERHTSGDHRKLLLAYVSISRSEGFEVDREMVLKDAKDLYGAGEKRLGTDEITFIRIFSERSRAQLAAISSAYRDLFRKALKKAVKKETSGKFEDGLLTILKCAENPAKYFAKVLRKAMKGLGTDDTTLLRVIVTRTEVDMQYIKAEYLRRYKKTLNDAVHSDTSGHYRTFLLTLLGA